MNNTSVRVRRATQLDSNDILTWRNDDTTRKMSRNTGIILKKDHDNWLTAALTNTDKVLLIAEDNQGKIGFLRFDSTDKGSRAEVSINLNPNRRDQKLSKTFLRQAKRFLPRGVNDLLACIKVENEVSNHIFSSSNYELKHSKDGYNYYILKIRK